MLPDLIAAAAAKESQRYVAIVLISAAEPLRLCIGAGLFETTSDDDLDASQTYLGNGMLYALPTFEQLVSGTGARQNIGLRAPRSELQNLRRGGANPVLGAQANIGFLVQDAAFQTIDKALWLGGGVIDQTTSGRSNGANILTLSFGSELIDRSHPGFTMWNNASHQALHSGDRFFERTSINNPFSEKWPA